MGPSKRIRPTTAERILAVTPADIAHGARVPAGPTWDNVERLAAAGVPRVAIAERIGQTRALQLGREWVQARHAREIAAMADELDTGTLVISRRSRWGDRIVTPPAGRDKEAEVRDPPVVDDIDRVTLDLVEVLEDRIDQAAWHATAACRGRPTWMWFPNRGDSKTLAAAKRVCSACLVRDECLNANRDERDGVYGGLSGRERRALRTPQEQAS